MDYFGLYADFLKKHFYPCKKLKVVFDCSNGAAGLVLKKVLKNKNIDWILINEKPDGNFPGHSPNPLEKKATAQLKKAVKKHQADLGVIFDADADRCFFLDHFGDFISSDLIGWILIWHLRPKKIIIDPRVGFLIKKNSPFASKFYYCRVGHFFIKQKMKKHRADLGIEKSGHFYFKDFFYCDSGIFAALKIIEALSLMPYSLSQLNSFLPQYFSSKEINFDFLNQKKVLKIFKVLIKKYQKQAKKISYLDGLKIEFSSWWFNLRLSNTEPKLRLNLEAKEKKEYLKRKKELEKIIKQYLN